MKPSIKTIYETLCLTCQCPGDTARMASIDSWMISCCGLLSAGIFIYYSCPVSYLLFFAVMVDLGSKQLFCRNFHGSATAMPVGLPSVLFDLTQYFNEDKNVMAFISRVKKYGLALCRLLGNTLLGTLGSEIAGLRAIFLPALGLLHILFKGLAQYAVLSRCIAHNNL